MRKMYVKHLKPGMTLAKTVYDTTGRPLLVNGQALRESYIDRLLAMGIHYVFVVDSRLTDVEATDILSEETRLRARLALKNIYAEVKKGGTLDINSIQYMVDNIINDILGSETMLSTMMDMRSFDDYTYYHSINVCALSVVTAMGMNYSRPELGEVGIGAILHDIGKVFVSRDILTKPEKLTDEEYRQVQKHTELGYETLKEYRDISLLSAHIAYQHHEYPDGNGYPRGLKGDDIHPYARLVSVSDVYDALTSDRVYRPGLLPHQAIEYILAHTGTQFFNDVVKAFVRYTPLYPIGTMVRLSNKIIGAVTDINQGFIGRPVVRVLYDERSQPLGEAYEIDLSKRHDLVVANIILDDRYFAD